MTTRQDIVRRALAEAGTFVSAQDLHARLRSGGEGVFDPLADGILLTVGAVQETSCKTRALVPPARRPRRARRSHSATGTGRRAASHTGGGRARWRPGPRAAWRAACQARP